MTDFTPPGNSTIGNSASPPAPPRYPPGGRMLDAGHGVTWWGDAWRLFTASPWLFIAIVVVFVVLMAALALVPIAGSLAGTVLSPVFAGGMLAGCRALDRGGELTLSHLFGGFAERLGPLVTVGLLYLAGSCVIFFVFVALLVALVGASAIPSLLAGAPIEFGIAMLVTLGFGAVLAGLIATLFGIPLLMACWFAPALVMLRSDEPFAAMKTSFAACLANAFPFLVYGLLGLAFAVAASIPLGLGWLVLAPVSVASVYTSYKDIFGD